MNDNQATTIDPRTGLEWSQTLGERVNWKNAKKVAQACSAGGHDDWRLPTIEELITLIDFSRDSPAANTDLFPDMQSSCYWSSTQLALSPGVYAWSVYFDGGGVYANYQDGTAFVRAVRGCGETAMTPNFRTIADGLAQALFDFTKCHEHGGFIEVETSVVDTSNGALAAYDAACAQGTQSNDTRVAELRRELAAWKRAASNLYGARDTCGDERYLDGWNTAIEKIRNRVAELLNENGND